MKDVWRTLRACAGGVLGLLIATGAALASPQAPATSPKPADPERAVGEVAEALIPAILPVDAPAPVTPPGTDDEITPAQLTDLLRNPDAATPTTNRNAPAPTLGAANPPAAATPPRRGFGAASNLFARGGASSVSRSGGSVTLNTMGDQGVISLNPPGNKGPAISIARNFALNLTDNNSAPLQNRLIPLEYYHFFDSQRVYPGLVFSPNKFAAAVVPSQTSRTKVTTQDDRYVFGFEAIVAPRVSILFRQSVVTIEQPGIVLQQGTKIHQLGGTRSGWSDLQISPKFLLYEDKKYTATAGAGMVIPIGANAPYHQFGNSAFVIQPFLLFLARPTDRLILQAGFEYDIPIAQNLSHVSLFRYLLFAGYKIYDDPESENIKQIYPIVEIHASDLVGGFTQDMVNLTVGVRVNAFKRTQFGLGYSTPLTVQHQYSNEVLFNYNIFF